MDALAFDISTPTQLQEEYTRAGLGGESKKREDDPEADPYRESEVANAETVPVEDSDGAGGSPGAPGAARAGQRNSTSSTSSSSSSSGHGPASLYQAEFLAPRITYDRDFEDQKLIAVIGREFDTPSDVASSLQKLVALTRRENNSETPVAKFVPFTVRRKVLLKGQLDSQELKRHDLICMAYNASEARIMLTGLDGYYTSLLRHTEAILGQAPFPAFIVRVDSSLQRLGFFSS